MRPVGGVRGQNGLARTGLGSLIALVVAAAVVVGGAFVWTQQDDPAAGSSSEEIAAAATSTTTTTTPEPARRVRMIEGSPNGQLRLSEEDLCALVDAEEVEELLDLPGPPSSSSNGKDRFYGDCNWSYKNTPVFDIYAIENGREASTRDAALDRYLGFDIRHPDECPFSQAIGTNGCFRISAIPRLGDEAWGTVLIATQYDGAPWVYDNIAFRRGGVEVRADVWQGPGSAGPAGALELLRLWDSRLPATFDPIPDPCPAEGC